VDGEIAGWFSLEPFRKKPAYRATSEISVYVSERRRRKGVGWRLLEEAIRRAPELGFKTLTGGIFAHNEPSFRLFEGFGFERWALYPSGGTRRGGGWTARGKPVPTGLPKVLAWGLSGCALPLLPARINSV
jgi:phosphinothricin acetyltransferase